MNEFLNKWVTLPGSNSKYRGKLVKFCEKPSGTLLYLHPAYQVRSLFEGPDQRARIEHVKTASTEECPDVFILQRFYRIGLQQEGWPEE